MRRLAIDWKIDGFSVPVKVKPRSIDEIAREIRTLQLRVKPAKTYKFNPHLPDDGDYGDYSKPCPECSATGQHYKICSQSED